MLGPVAPHFQDIKKTPVGPLTGPQLHLQAAACGLEGAFVRHAGSPSAMMIGLGLIGALLAGWLVKPWVSTQAMILFYLAVAVSLWWMGVSSVMLPVTGGVLAATVGWVAAQIYQLVHERLEKGRLRGQFRRFVSRDVADQLVDHPQAWLEIAAGRKRQVVVLFSDVRDFTTRSEVSEPSELVKQLNEYLTAMVAVVFHHGGTLDKFIGDAVMAHWGALEDAQGGVHAKSALAAARDMQSELEELNRKWEQEGREPFRMGVGIHLGEAVAGELGSPQRIEFGVIGDAVNLASRIEGLTKIFGCEVMFSSQVRDAADEGQAIDLGQVRVKGRAAPVALFGFGDPVKTEASLAKLSRDEDGVVVMTNK
jgi:adenylate cyclase